MGLILTFLTIYIHVFDQNILNFSLSHEILTLTLDLNHLIGIGIVCIPLVTCIANIMLANNLCDMDEDFPNKRYTLPIYIGREKGLILWEMLYYIAYMAILVGVILGVLPWISLIIIITLIPIRKNIQAFKIKQFKGETFVCAIKNFLIFNVTYILSLILGILFF